MKKTFKNTCALILVGFALCGDSQAAERPTMNVTRDPRPDILAHPFYYAHTEYRREYNRPRFATGWIAAQIAPSSQEAMVWFENLQAGRYDSHNMPPVYKRYFAPKPWEVLQTGARPDFAHPSRTMQPAAQPIRLEDSQAATRRISEASPSDARVRR